ncbi:helix-turn-helix domain-containing protein [Tunturiibacter empetritectus]|uniref:Methylphosphotriester-DNA--protein-cysteine methyltransferase n=2 Tax=Tunturiibacter empetritectus TaxID=3069691 RepID=A0A7W8ILM0_9BACT|nr:methylphosphotriester-DNA--protein-cysteine methyltransferase [Edaphobacter lichenicola]
MPACLEQIIEFEFGNFPIVEFGDGSLHQTHQIVVVGPSAYRRANIRLRGGLQSFAIFFQPMAFWQLFGIPVRELANQHYDCCDVIGTDIHQLWNEMANNASFDKRVKLVEAFLLKKARRSIENTPIMSAALYMFAQNGKTRIDHIANRTSLSVRQFERRFSSEIGMSPKLFARVSRFQMVLDAKVKSLDSSWLDLAHKFGYHDQMHMIKDFQGLSGFSPGSLLEQLGDMRPPALAAAEIRPNVQLD